MWRPGSSTFVNLPHYCSKPRLVIYWTKTGFDLQGQQLQQRQHEQYILHGVQQAPKSVINLGKQYWFYIYL